MAASNVLPTSRAGEAYDSLRVVPAAIDATDADAEIEFEIGHVLFIDIVGYSKLLLDEQRERLRELNEIVRGTRQFQRAETEHKLVRLPTGDGMALVFRSSPEAPAQCALEISAGLRTHPQIQLRMGIHSGPVNEVSDVNERANIAGAGINIAQRVMDCGDAGHILISKHVAEDLEHSARWRPNLHALGEYGAKHGAVISVVNLFTEELGNPAVPSKLRGAANHVSGGTRFSSRRTATRVVLAAAMATLVAAGIVGLRHNGKTTGFAANAAAVPEKSIAVLPFENLSANPETAFFTDGVQDEILTDLAKVADLKVISRTSVMQYRDAAKRNLREIAQQFGVAHVLEGSVQRSGDRIRVNAQLIDARTDAHLWAQTFDGDLADVFAIQSEIAKAIAEQLQAKLSAKEQAELQAKPTENVAAYDLYLRATQIDRNRASSIGSGGAEGAKREIALLEEAIQHDPSFVPAICLVAQVHLYLHWMNVDAPGVHLEAAGRAVEAAERLQPNSGVVHLTRAIYYYWGARNYSAALAEVAISRRNLPNDTRGLFVTAMIERRQNQWSEAIRHLEQAFALDPCNITIISELAGTYGILLRYDDAARTVDNALAWKHDDFGLASLRAYIDLIWKGDLARWHAAVAGEFAKNADPNDLITSRIDLALRERNYREAERLLAQGGGNETDDNGFFTPREWKQAIAARGLGDGARAHSALLAARERVAAVLKTKPDDAKTLIVLGQIDGALGRRGEALQEGQRAVELLPASKDGVNGHQLLARLICIHAELGDTEQVLSMLENGRHLPYAPDYGSLKLDQVWDSMRGNPRFEKLLAAAAPKD